MVLNKTKKELGRQNLISDCNNETSKKTCNFGRTYKYEKENETHMEIQQTLSKKKIHSCYVHKLPTILSLKVKEKK